MDRLLTKGLSDFTTFPNDFPGVKHLIVGRECGVGEATTDHDSMRHTLCKIVCKDRILLINLTSRI